MRIDKKNSGAEKKIVILSRIGATYEQKAIVVHDSIMKTFGVEVIRRKDAVGKLLDVYDIPNGVYNNPANYSIESDAGSATYPLAIVLSLFAKEVLEVMGCKVVQTPTETTVYGPPIGQLKAIEEVDMTEMTDTFLTATVLAAVAHGKTRILGIANQHVKEYNRIKAMIDEVSKFGVETNELDDDLEIIGKSISELKTGVSVHCYDDHRVAMAFSVLSTVVDGTILEEKGCVDKTWPNWWDDLENKIGIKVEGVQLDTAAAEASASGSHTPEPSSSVILIGMRCTGKITVGNMAASALSWVSLDADTYFEDKYKIGVREFVHQRGWPAFREAETETLQELFKEKAKGHVIRLGGGIVETSVARALLKEYAATGAVVHITRPINDVIGYLNAETSRPAYEEPITDVFRRREPWFIECSNYIYNNQFGDSTSSQSTFREVSRFFKHVTCEQPNLAANLRPGTRSYFLSHIDELTQDVDALELRVDLLKSPKDYESFGNSIITLAYVQEQVSALRRVSSLPIVFTVRTKSQGGAFPDSAEKESIDLLKLALQMGVEYIDVEIILPEK
ncbi:hypothetical protein BDN70DRAFT_938910 [Pholiota conissans]|uniref:Enolpyruvate transferase domain-containing protein n=1 Tax=Pholiota conissans TaxID=109636 RepID=A0A9P5YLS0_9AGAR|nr:hypothetical protein BDN70DRAFT_938910 [Pholiota conissans]